MRLLLHKTFLQWLPVLIEGEVDNGGGRSSFGTAIFCFGLISGVSGLGGGGAFVLAFFAGGAPGYLPIPVWERDRFVLGK